MENDPLWVVPASFVLVAALNLTQSRGRVNVAFAALFVAFVAYLSITFTITGSRPSGELVLVTVLGALYLVVGGIRPRVAGTDVFLTTERPLRRGWSAARIRGRVDRDLRRAQPAPAPDDAVPTVGGPAAGDDVGEVVVTAAREAGRGDLAAAVTRLDTALFPAEKPSSWPDARLGLLLYHRTVYSALAAAAGDSPADPGRWHGDLTLARTVLPDVRLGWLADAAVAVAEGRPWAAVYATDALLADARGPWEKGVGAVVGRLARDVPDEYRERRYARLVERHPWVAGLARRLDPTAAPA